MHRDGCCTVWIDAAEVTLSESSWSHSPFPDIRVPANISHLTFFARNRRVSSIGRYRPQDCLISPSQLPRPRYRSDGDDLTEQDKVRITLKFNFVRFPTSLGSINIHASLESPYARLYPLP